MNIKISGVAWLLTGLIVLGSWGCGGPSTGQVTGTVTVDGTPVNGLEVTFIPVDAATGGEALAYTRDGGNYALVQGRGNKQIPTGDYKVTISVFSEDPNLETPRVNLGSNYTSSQETELKATVAGGENTIDFDLTTK